MNAFSATELGAMAAEQLSTLGTASGIGENITIRRGASTLSSQNVRISRPQSPRNTSGDGGRAMRQSVLITGGTELDIAVADRFNDQHGVLYEVVFVRPNRQIDTVAEAEAVQ